MKKHFKFLPLALLGFCLVLNSCSEEDLVSPSKNSNNLEWSLGLIHNQFLTHTMRNFDYDAQYESEALALKALANFQSQHFNTYPSVHYDMKTAKSVLEENTSLYKIGNVQSVLSDGVEMNNQVYQLEDLNDLYVSEGLINEIDAQIVNSIIADIRLNLSNSLSNNQVYQNLLLLKSDWDESQNNSKPGSVYSFIILDISINSLEWWSTNGLEANSQQKLAPWICADIAGAIIGAGLSVGYQHYLGSGGDINWRIVAASGLTTAIMGSTGALGRIGRWMSKW